MHGQVPIRLSARISSTTTMPSDQSTWLIAVPNDGDAEGLLPEITSKLAQVSRSSQTAVTEFAIPAFKVDLPSSLLIHHAVLIQRRTRRPAR